MFVEPLKKLFNVWVSVYLARVGLSKDLMNSRDILSRLVADGWVEVARVGSHLQMKHPAKKGRVTVPHPRRDVAIGTLKSIEKQAGLKLR